MEGRLALSAFECQSYSALQNVRVTSASDPDRDRFRDWPTPARYTVYGVASVVLLLVLALIAGMIVVRRPLPQTTGDLRLEGLDDTVQVRRDGLGVPQIYAGTSHDLFYAQGFVQAQDRFWQMDYRRHLSAGRLSELFGARTLSSDMTARTLGWYRTAEREYQLVSAEAREALDSYSDGVNAWLSSHSGSGASLEYTVLSVAVNYRPEPWTPVDSLAWLKSMAWDLAGNVEDEIARARLSVDRDPAQVAELYPSYPYAERAPIVDTRRSAGQAARPAALPASRITGAMLRPLERVARSTREFPRTVGSGDGLGSNGWVVAGSHTTTGNPLLANDPHLDVGQPGVFYQMGLHCRTVGDSCPYDVAGFSWAGFPGIAIGHNDDIAWGMTNLHADTTDLYLEKVTGKDYLYDARRLPMEERDERIRIAGGDSKLITVRSTRHGPLVSDVSRELSSVGANAPAPTDAPERGNGYAVAVDWTASTPGTSTDALLAMNRAGDWAAFRAAAADLGAPATSLVYSDSLGNIGYQAAGAVPIRRAGHTGDYPAAGWEKSQDWTGKLVPATKLPTELNPASGVIVAANQAVTGPSYPYRLADWFDYGYRSNRIHRLLRAGVADGSKLRAADMAEIQNDTRNPMGPVLVPYLLDVLLPSAYYASGQQLLSGWDYTQPDDSAAAAYFNAVWRKVLELTFHDQLRESLWPDGSSRWMAVMTRLLRASGQPVVGRRGHQRRGREPRRDPRQGHAGGPRRAGAPAVARPEALDLGPPAPAAARPSDVQLRQLDGRCAVRPARPWCSGRHWRGQRDRLGPARGLCRHQRAGDADGGRPRRPRPQPVGQPGRPVRPRLRRPLHRPGRPVARRPDRAVAVLWRRGAASDRRHAGAQAGGVTLPRCGAHADMLRRNRARRPR